jgi:hypothetical protein
MTFESRHVSVTIDRPVAEVYAFASNPENLPRWAPGLGSAVIRADEGWLVETPHGRARVTFAPPNEYGVLDHEVLTPTGETVYVPLRAFTNAEGCDVVFTVRRTPGMTAEDLTRDITQVEKDLTLLKNLLEAGKP